MNNAMAVGASTTLLTDPFDRLLIAVAQTYRLSWLTLDPLIHQYAGLTALR